MSSNLITVNSNYNKKTNVVETNKLQNKPPIQDVNSGGWLVIALIAIIFTIVLAWIIVALIKDSTGAEVIQRCNPGLCKFSTISGVKTCPTTEEEAQGIRVNLGAEFCTSRDYCQKQNYQCAVQLDQTVLCDGVCGFGNEQCRCVSSPFNPPS